MSERSISAVAPGVHLEFLPDGTTPTVSSLDVARHFQKKHKHVLDEIRRIQSICPKSFLGPNFRPMLIEVSIGNGAVRKDPAYLITRDGFSLLVMGFTGKAAIQWKLRYIEAFNALEAAVRENLTDLARRSGYELGLAEARALPAAEAERKEAYLEGMKEGVKIQRRKDGLARLLKALRFTRAGLTQKDAGAALGMTGGAVGKMLARARAGGVIA